MTLLIQRARRHFRLLGFLCVAAFGGWCLFAFHKDLARISFTPMLHSWNILFIATGLSLVSFVLRVIRWQWYLRWLQHPLTFTFSTLTYFAGFAFTLSPAKMGEVVRARYYTETGIPLRDVVAAYFMERSMDLLAMLALAALIVSALPYDSRIIWFVAIAVSVALVALAVLPWTRIAHIASSWSRLPRAVSRSISGIAATLAGMHSLLRPGAVICGFLISLVAWGVEGVGLSVLASMFAPANIDVSVAIGIYALAELVGVLSFVPAGLGSTEAVMTSLFVAWGYSVADALVISIAYRIVTLWLAVVLGWLAIVILRYRVQQRGATS